jgi:hypothetical protein
MSKKSTKDGDGPDGLEDRYVKLTSCMPLMLRKTVKIWSARVDETMAEFVTRAIEERIARLRESYEK